MILTIFKLTTLSHSNLPTSNLVPPPPLLELTNQDVETANSEAGHTPTETDYYYEEAVLQPESEVIGQEGTTGQVNRT